MPAPVRILALSRPVKCHTQQPPDRLRLGGLWVRLVRDPSVQLSVHLRIEADADDRADASFWAAPASFFVNGYCGALEYKLTIIRAGGGFPPALTTTRLVKGAKDGCWAA